jgi:2'-5' RNA ligase
MRTFIAIDLAPELRAALENLVARLKATGADVRWVGPKGMHLTLKFLGEVERDEAKGLAGALGPIVSKYRRFPLVLRGTGRFPPQRAPRVLWVGFEPEDSLMALQRDIDAGLAALGYPAEDRRFHPHLTLGRVKSATRLGGALAELEKRREEVFGRMTVEKIILYESLLNPAGAEYKPVQEFDLA